MTANLAQPTPATVPPPGGGAAEFVRIGLAGPAGRADLAVPANVPVARLLPSLLSHAGAEPGPDGGVRHGGWVLRRADGTRLLAATSLAAQGVVEGDLLFLGHGAEDTGEPLYDDVVEVIGESGPAEGWSPAATRRVSAALATGATLAATAALAVAPGRLPGWLGLATAVLALVVGVLLARAFGDVAAGTCAAVLAAPPALLGAVRLLGTEAGTVAGFTAGHLLLACAVLAVLGALGPLLVGGGDGTFTALVVAGPLTAVGALPCAVWDVHPARAAAVVAPLALALTTLWPTLALRVARMPAPDVAATTEELAALPSQLTHGQLRARVAGARRLLIGMLAGSHLVAVGGTLVLFAAGQLWAGVLGTVLVVLTLLRARLFREPGQTAIPLVGALLAAVGGAAFTLTDLLGQRLAPLGVALPVALVVALVAATVGLLAGRTRLNPRLSRALDLLETTALLAVVPLALAVWDVYAALLDLRA
ncbi:type VII secretion integral membrane protein EccD [Streptomyces sp. DSM 44915]|uniref:Type VII secretion integral membrane protein EccD n=1 Tax=Streptomyces chisholmiae TaxID=3075540 RepID=A0ABU2JPW1_9ACTN|nr:type VII secretion integral membrane protein EccD [Streptomyces sp. DSM 44915]MDT0266243.1 type VII secretion integral membrane protein EccD [Streptomyces sp. DSM 44915]